MKMLCLIAALLAQSALAWARTPEAISGLLTPESVVQAKNGDIFVSEINEFGKDGDGQIRKIDKKGRNTVFAKGMDDPKGLAIIGDKLYVADKARILEVNKDGTWQVYVEAKAFPAKPQFLNDLEADKLGNLYVSDSGDLKTGGAIYKIAKGGSVTTIANSMNPDIHAPNGLLFEGRDNLLAVDFDTGMLYRVDISSGATTKLAEGFGGGDGIVKTKTGKIFISDWKNGMVYHVSGGKARVVQSGFEGAADLTISQDGKWLLLPVMKSGELAYIGIK